MASIHFTSTKSVSVLALQKMDVSCLGVMLNFDPQKLPPPLSSTTNPHPDGRLVPVTLFCLATM
jgi:hypothetical protein